MPFGGGILVGVALLFVLPEMADFELDDGAGVDRRRVRHPVDYGPLRLPGVPIVLA